MNQRQLTVELRPRRLSEMVGQDKLVSHIRNQFSAGQVPIAILLTGSYGTGKTTIARILALSFNCSHQKEFGEPCDECLAQEDLLNFIERDCALLTKKEDMMEFIPTLSSYPNYGNYRIILLDEMQQASETAQQLLLKTFEDNSVNIFIIGTTNPEKINQGIKDRCVPFAIPELTAAGVEAVVRNTMNLAEQRFNRAQKDPLPLVKSLIESHIRNSRNIVMATDLYLSGMDVEQAILVGEGGEVNFLQLFKAVGWGKWDEAKPILAKAKPADGATIKMRLSYFFRDQLMKCPVGQRADLLSLFIKELADCSAVESGLMLSMVVAACYRICQTVQRVKANGGALHGATVERPSQLIQ